MIYLQVRAFWAQLEAATNERQQAMFRMLNVHLKHLAQRVETAVGELLEVRIISPAADPTCQEPLHKGHYFARWQIVLYADPTPLLVQHLQEVNGGPLSIFRK